MTRRADIVCAASPAGGPRLCRNAASWSRFALVVGLGLVLPAVLARASAAEAAETAPSPPPRPTSAAPDTVGTERDAPKQSPSAESGQEDAPPAEVHVEGLGWWRNRQLRKALELLETEEAPRTRIDAPFVEDAAVILQSALEQDGFLRSSASIVVRRDGAIVARTGWSPGEFPQVPRDLEGDEVTFELEPGTRYRFEHLDFDGLTVIPPEDARGYFIEQGFLLGGTGARRFTPARLRRGVGNLQEQLMRMGYADAKVEVASETRDNDTGTVDVRISVSEGRRHIVHAVQPPPDLPAGARTSTETLATQAAGAIYSPLWEQDFLREVRGVLYGEGYAEAEARLEPQGTQVTNGEVAHNFALVVEPGPQVHVGEVHFEGAGHTHRSILDRAVDVREGQLFNRNLIEKDRLKLGALGIFSSVRARIDRSDEDTWDLTYQLRPGQRLEVSLLAGYGSYEQFRGGVEVFHANLFGLAHRGRLQLIQSMKASYADYLYTVPQIFGTTTDASARLFGLEREEESFDRREYGTSIGLRRHVSELGADAALRYQFESVTADLKPGVLAPDAPTDSRVASLTLDLTRDRRDNPLLPHSGSFAALTLETAATAIGGEVDYQRIELRTSWHRRIGSERYLHLGFRHGILWAFGSGAEDIPLAKRFFPGGESTIRGYTEGRAAPRGPEGAVLGAEVSTIVNLELEQSLTRQLSLVAFLDAGLTGFRLADYPGNEYRVSAGIGLRFSTVIGPARLEYGHNIVREDRDQIGQLHLALGYPF